MSDYRITFTAVSMRPMAADAGERLVDALAVMPGADGVEGAHLDPAGRIMATFWIDVRLGMADAARDGSRLAKEGLKVAGLGDAQLVELSVALQDRTGAGAPTPA